MFMKLPSRRPLCYRGIGYTTNCFGNTGLCYKDTEWHRYICPGVAIMGTFFLSGLGEKDLDDLPDELMEKYEKLLWEPYTFIRTPKGPMVITGNGQSIPIR